VALFSISAAAVFTNYLQRTTSQAIDSLHAIRMVQQLELDLLTHARSTDPPDRPILEREIRSNLQQASAYVGTEKERDAFRRAAKEVEHYFDRAHSVPAGIASNLPELEAAHGSVQQLLDINVTQAGEVENATAHWGQLAHRLALLAVFAMVATIAMVLLWLWRLAFRPVLNIRDAMTDFASGRRMVRVAETGPDELRSIAVQFNQMAEALSRQHEDQLTFLTGIAHDLRNPLAPLKLATTTIDSEGPLPSEGHIRTILSIVRRQVDRLDRMVGDLLDASKIEAGQLDLQRENLDARAVAREVFELFQMASPAHKIELQLAEEPIPLNCDGLRIEQVLNNIVSNAIKYSPNGGRVRIAVGSDGTGAVFQVSDEGVGIKPEDMPFIFKPFHRIRGGDQKIPGIGLGLSTARRIIEAHGGRIDVKSEPGKGTTFSVHVQ
jgi:two-component system, OmpR family, sensor histidine kinase MtrB